MNEAELLKLIASQVPEQSDRAPEPPKRAPLPLTPGTWRPQAGLAMHMELPEPTTLHLMVGLPQSGKTQRAAELSKQYEAPMVQCEAIYHAMTGPLNVAGMEPQVEWLAASQVGWYLTRGVDCVLDSANLNRDARRRWVELAQQFDCQVLAHVCMCERSTRYERLAALRYSPEINAIAERLFEVPAIDEGFDLVTSHYSDPEEQDPATRHFMRRPAADLPRGFRA